MTVLQSYMRFTLVEHEVSLDLCHAHPLPLSCHPLCKLLRAGQRLLWVEPLEHLLDLVLRGVVYPHLHVHTTRPNEGRIQPKALREDSIHIQNGLVVGNIGTFPGSW